jgi:hypothetical protein
MLDGFDRLTFFQLPPSLVPRSLRNYICSDSPLSLSRNQSSPKMPIRLEDGREFIEDGREFIEDAGQEVGKRARRFWHGFSSFALQDNVLEVAVGLM